MTNPNNALGTNAAYGGRTSVNAFNDILGVFSGRGVLQGWGVSPGEGMSVVLGGSGLVRDVAIAEDNYGNRTTINNISQAPVELEIAAAPSTGSRIDAIVAYVDNPPAGQSTIADNPGAVGLLDVVGTAAASPAAPTEADIRTAITADGASGTTAYYVVLATVTIQAGLTDITASDLTSGDYAGVGPRNIDWASIDIAPYRTSLITTLGARQRIGYSGGVGIVTTAGCVASGYGVVFDNIPVSVPYTQELGCATTRPSENPRAWIASNGDGTSLISVNHGITYPATLFLRGAFVIER